MEIISKENHLDNFEIEKKLKKSFEKELLNRIHKNDSFVKKMSFF